MTLIHIFALQKFEASEMLAVHVVTMSWHGLETFEPAPDLYQYQIASNTRIQIVTVWSESS